MYKKFLVSLFCLIPAVSYGDDLIATAQSTYDAVRIVCSGISDEISRVSNVSKVNTAVTGAGTVAAGGALIAGAKKSSVEAEIDELAKQICDAGGCDPNSVEAMTDEEFMNNVLIPMSQIAEKIELSEMLQESKQMGNWRTGLMVGTVGANVASAILAGVNKDQSELVQHIQACNESVKSARDMYKQLKQAGINPMEHSIGRKLAHINDACNDINISDIEKIEKRMTGVMGTSIAGAVVGVAGVATSASANSDKYMYSHNRLEMTDADRKKKDNLNKAANVMAGANVVTGAVETGLNISLINLTKKLMAQAEQCEGAME